MPARRPAAEQLRAIFRGAQSRRGLRHMVWGFRRDQRESGCARATGALSSIPPSMVVFAWMIIDRLTTLEELQGLVPEWSGVDAIAGPRLPFATAEWAASWWAHLREERVGLRDRLFTLVLRDDQRRLLGVAPLMITERPGAGPLRARCLQFIGADPHITEVRGLCVRAGYEEAVYREVCNHVLRAGDEWDWMQVTGVDAAGPGPAVLEEFGAQWTGQISDWLLPLPGTWSEFHAGLTRNIKESLRKCSNAPRRDGLNFRFEVSARPEEMGPALEEFFQLHGERSTQEGGVLHRDNFSGRAARSFLLEVCGRMAQRGMVHVFRLKDGPETIAIRLGFRLGDAMYLYYSGYRLRYGRYSVMTTCVAEAIRWCMGAGLRTVNLSTGTDESKLRWGPREHVFREARLCSPTVRGRLAEAAYRWAERQMSSPLLRGALGGLRRRS